MLVNNAGVCFSLLLSATLSKSHTGASLLRVTLEHTRASLSCLQHSNYTLTAGMSKLPNFHTDAGVAALAQSNYLGTYQVITLL